MGTGKSLQLINRIGGAGLEGGGGTDWDLSELVKVTTGRREGGWGGGCGRVGPPC